VMHSRKRGPWLKKPNKERGNYDEEPFLLKIGVLRQKKETRRHHVLIIPTRHGGSPYEGAGRRGNSLDGKPCSHRA